MMMDSTARVWAFSEEERIADIAVANEAGSFVEVFLRSKLAKSFCSRGYFST
jgi:hypothetical protein